MTVKTSHVGFLDLPISIREKIYAYLLLPHLEEDVTTINYTLEWPHLENPSNTTFVGLTQIDFCTYPCAITNEEAGEDASDSTEGIQEDGNHPKDQHGPHVYMRHRCLGPEGRFKAPREGFWVLEAAHS